MYMCAGSVACGSVWSDAELAWCGAHELQKVFTESWGALTPGGARVAALPECCVGGYSLGGLEGIVFEGWEGWEHRA